MNYLYKGLEVLFISMFYYRKDWYETNFSVIYKYIYKMTIIVLFLVSEKKKKTKMEKSRGKGKVTRLVCDQTEQMMFECFR